jgi:hypothetical protein
VSGSARYPINRPGEPWIDHDEGVRIVPRRDGGFDYLPLEQVRDEPWFCEPKDRDPAPEIDRQGLFLSRLLHMAPSCHVIAVPNAGRRSNWEALQRHREGMRGGALDLVITWKRNWDLPGDNGVYFAEFKNGTKMPSQAQRDELNLLYRQGHHCGVYRKPDTLLAHLKAAGAPFITRENRL